MLLLSEKDEDYGADRELSSLLDTLHEAFIIHLWYVPFHDRCRFRVRFVTCVH